MFLRLEQPGWQCVSMALLTGEGEAETELLTFQFLPLQTCKCVGTLPALLTKPPGTVIARRWQGAPVW